MATPKYNFYKSTKQYVYVGMPYAGDNEDEGIAWVPPAGGVAQIGYAQGTHPSSLAATMYDARPAIQSWNPGTDPWKTSNNYGFATIHGYCGGVWIQSLRKWAMLGGGHASYCVPGLIGYNVPNLAWEWMETPLPTDGFSLVAGLGNSDPNVDRAAMAAAYTNGQFDTTEWRWVGNSSSWGALAQPGKYGVEPAHTYYGLVWVPGPSVGNTNGIVLKCAPSSGRMPECLVPTRHYFDLDDNLWKLTTNFRSNPSAAAGGSIYFGGTIDRAFSMTYTSGGHFPSVIDVFDPSTLTWSTTPISGGAVALQLYSGGLIAHIPTSLLIYCQPAASQVGAGTYDNANQHQFWAVNASSVKAGSSVSFQQLSVSNPGGTWPVRATYGTYCGQVTWTAHPNGNFYAINGNNGSNKIWKLSPPAGATSPTAGLSGTWTVSEETLTGTIPCGATGGPTGSALPAGGTGTLDVFNRLIYDSVAGCFLFFDTWYQSRPVAIRPVGT